MIQGIEQVRETINRSIYILGDLEDDETVYFNLIVTHVQLIRLIHDVELPSRLRNLILEAAEVLEAFISRGGLSSFDLEVIRKCFECILSSTETGVCLEAQEEEPEILRERQAHLDAREEIVPCVRKKV